MIIKSQLRARILEGLLKNKIIQLSEIIGVFGAAFIVLYAGSFYVEENPVTKQALAWIANILMLFIIWLGLRLRGQNLKHFGLSLQFSERRKIFRAIFISFLVFLAAVAAFVLGSIIMANIIGIPESSDMSGYNYIQGNLPMLLLALVGSYIVSSFGEEVIYRGFLINRISELGSNSKRARWGAILFSSIIFGLIHFEWGVMGMVQTGFMGLALSISYIIVKRNLWITILAHAYMDTILFLQLYFVPIS